MELVGIQNFLFRCIDSVNFTLMLDQGCDLRLSTAEDVHCVGYAHRLLVENWQNCIEISLQFSVASV